MADRIKQDMGVMIKCKKRRKMAKYRAWMGEMRGKCVNTDAQTPRNPDTHDVLPLISM